MNGSIVSFICGSGNTYQSVYFKLKRPWNCPVLSLQEQPAFLNMFTSSETYATTKLPLMPETFIL